jgi:F0F1-type ATP synthase beta subunit
VAGDQDSKASLLERLGQESKQAAAPVKAKDSKNEAAARKAEETKKAEADKKAAAKKGGKRKGPLPAFFAEIGVVGLFGGAVVGATKFEREVKVGSRTPQLYR